MKFKDIFKDVVIGVKVHIVDVQYNSDEFIVHILSTDLDHIEGLYLKKDFAGVNVERYFDVEILKDIAILAKEKYLRGHYKC